MSSNLKTDVCPSSTKLIFEKLSKDELISLLGHYETELQAQEYALSFLKAQHLIANGGKLFDYNRSAGPAEDAELALLRDVHFDASVEGRRGAQPPLASALYRAHIEELEKLARVQQAANRKAKQTLNALEKRHARILHEMHLEKERAQNNSLKSDEFFLLIENERSKVQAQLDQKDEEIRMLEKELERSKRALRAEEEREKMMVLYLFNERKRLLLQLNEMRMRLNNKNELEDAPLVQELRRRLIGLNKERDSLSASVSGLQSDKASLRQKVRGLEEDLRLIQQNVLLKTREQSETLERNNKQQLDALILANRGAFASEKQLQQQTPYYHHHTHPATSTHHQRQASLPYSASASQRYTPAAAAGFSTPGGVRGSASRDFGARRDEPGTPSRASCALPQLPKSGAATANSYGPTTTPAAASSQPQAAAVVVVAAAVTHSAGVPSSYTATPATNGVAHSTMLLHRSSGRPPLGVKASNLPLNRNVSVAGEAANPLVAYRPNNNATSTTASTAGRIGMGTAGVLTRAGDGALQHRPGSATQLPVSTSFPTSISTAVTPVVHSTGFYPPTLQQQALSKRSSSLPRNMLQNVAQHGFSRNH